MQSCHCTYVSPFCSFCPAYSIQGANKCHKSYQMTTLTPPQTQQFILLTVCRRAIHPTATGRPIPQSNTILLLLYYVHSQLLFTVHCPPHRSIANPSTLVEYYPSRQKNNNSVQSLHCLRKHVTRFVNIFINNIIDVNPS